VGLDNGFTLHNKKNNTQINLFHFRKYYELADFFRRYPMLPRDDNEDGPSYLYAVTESNLKELQHEITPIYQALIKLPENTIAYYDENGYPSKYTKLFYGNDFDPTSSQSSFAGTKLVRLYQRIEALLEILDNSRFVWYNDEEHKDDTYEIVFYDSF
jgi:hypothetical protein